MNKVLELNKEIVDKINEVRQLEANYNSVKNQLEKVTKLISRLNEVKKAGNLGGKTELKVYLHDGKENFIDENYINLSYELEPAMREEVQKLLLSFLTVLELHLITFADEYAKRINNSVKVIKNESNETTGK